LWSVFKFSVVAYLVGFLLVFIMMLVAYIIALAAGSLSTDQQAGQLLQQMSISGGVLLLLTFFGGILGSIVCAIGNWFTAVMYNLLAMMTGGIEISIERTDETAATAPPAGSSPYA